jgi:hypothetical protein
MEMMSAVNVSPDGYRVVFTGGQSKAEVWTIKNLLPTVAPAIASSR